MKNGGIIGPKNNVSISLASGIFFLNEQLSNRRKNTWPAVPSYAYIGQFEDLANSTSYSMTGINVVSPGLIVFSVSTDVGTSTVTSLTANGISATKVNEVNASGASVSLWYLELPTSSSTTLSVTATTSTAAARCILGVYRINDYLSAQPINQVSNTNPGTIVSLTTGVLQTNSILIAGYVNTNPATTTFTGVNEDFDTTTSENGSAHAGGSIRLVAGGNRDVIAESSAVGPIGLVTAAWR